MASTGHYFSPRSGLKPVRVDAAKRVIRKGNKTPVRWWRVNVGKRFTGTSKIRRFFDTEKDAKDYVDDVLAAARERGRLAFAIPQALAVEAMALNESLNTQSATLTDAVKFFLRHTRAATGKTVNRLLPHYLSTKTNPQYRKDQEFSLRVFAREFGERPINSISVAEIDKWFRAKNWKPLNLRNRMRDLSMLFKWAKFQDHISENPLERIARPKVRRTTPAIFTVEETRAILEAAIASPELGLLPMMAFCFFSGVRIEEVEKMRWEMVDWEEGEIRLPESVAKFGIPRNIEITDALRAWIGQNPPKSGRIVDAYALRRRRQQLLERAGLPPKRNALRHSFASYHAAKFQNPSLLQMQMGQQTPSVLFRHYIQAVRRADAEAYFALRPKKLMS